MRAQKLLFFAPVLYGLILVQCGALSAFMQSPPSSDPTKPEPVAPTTGQKDGGVKPAKEIDKPEDVVQQESRKAPETGTDPSESEQDSIEEDTPLTEQQLEDAKAILSTSEQIVVAYEKGDAKIASAQFTEDAEYVDEHGNVYRGRAEIERILTEYFAEHPSCRLEIDVDSIRFVGAGVAVEDGETTVTHRDHAHVTGDDTAARSTQPGESSEAINRLEKAPSEQNPKRNDPPSEGPSPSTSPVPPATTTPRTPADNEQSDARSQNRNQQKSDEKDTAAAKQPDDAADSKAAPAQQDASTQPSIDSDAIDPSLLSDPDAEHHAGSSATVRCRYSAVYTKVDGKWLVASVRDFPHEERREHFAQLQSLNWLLGDWVDESEDSLVHFSCEPADNGNYLIRTFSIVIDGEESFSGTQRIGWCPLTGKLRSWIFDSEGGYADGFWHRDGDDWVLKCAGVTADGETASYTSVYRVVNDHTITWQYVDYELAGERQPDSEVFTIVQSPPTPTPAVAVGDR